MQQSHQDKSPAPQASAPRIAIDVGVVVDDLERSLEFYRDLLSLPVVSEVTTSLIGQGRMVQLKYGPSLIKLVKLEKTPPRRGPTGIDTNLGYRYITLLVSDIAAIMTRIEQDDIPIVMPVTQHGKGTTIAMVQDPDGNIIEFVQEFT